jgi:hypothetical protein
VRSFSAEFHESETSKQEDGGEVKYAEMTSDFSLDG